MFTVAWGQSGVDLLERATHSERGEIERCGPLAVRGAEAASDERWRCWLTGRLDNSAELRDRLRLPAGTSNVNVIARAYARLGSDACTALRGTFVVVAFDRERGVATVARDHLGGRPLLYARIGTGALLAEHERAIVDLMPATPAPDRLALAQWIDSGCLPVRRTLFAGIERVPPAHRVRLGPDSIALERYWRPHFEGVDQDQPDELAGRLRSAAFAAVDRATEGARTPALLLSGGLDSSCVAAALAAGRGRGGRVLALSGVFPSRPQTDERELIEATAAHTGLPVELVAFDERSSILPPALEHLERWRLPPATPNLFAWQPVMARARALGVDAMLDGEGGDELFGFAAHLIADRLRAGRVLSAWRLTGRIPGVGKQADMRMRMRALRIYGMSPLLPAELRRRRELRRVLASTRTLVTAVDQTALLLLQREDEDSDLDGPLWWRELAKELTRPGEVFAASAHLRREAADERIDRRHPFLFDMELLSVVLQTPPALLFEVRDRALLRDGLSGHIPERVRTRQEKSVFNGLLDAGLATAGTTLAFGPAERDAPVRSYVRAERLQLLLGEATRPRDGAAARRLWQACLADIWLRSLHDPLYPQKLRERALSRV